jgi:sulfite reductase (NADPH) hemoprotein beta-component
MVGGGTTATGASFARTAAKVPARRVTEALERLIAFYQREKQDGESAPQFFQRVPLEAVTRELLDLQRLTEAEATPEDFVDLAETGAFAPEVMDGECSA